MKSVRLLLVTVGSLGILGLAASSASADYGGGYDTRSGVGFSVMGGVQALNKNKAALPDHLINIPVAAALSYDLTQDLALEGTFTWLIPVKRDINNSLGFTEKARTPDMLSYMGNLKLGLGSGYSVKPYITAGAGAVTFLKTTDADRVPQFGRTVSTFGANAGLGAEYAVSGPLSLRVDFREVVAIPRNGQAGFTSAAGDTKDIWMERGTIGLTYGF